MNALERPAGAGANRGGDGAATTVKTTGGAGAASALPPIMISAVALLPWAIKQKLRPRNLLLLNSPKTHETLLKHD
jgi:hypothetical protein